MKPPPFDRRAARTPERLKGLVAAWAITVKANPTRVQVREMNRKIASCSSAGTLTFSKRLLRQPRRLQDQVIVHELLHLHVPNHGKLFKSLLSAYLGQADGAYHCGGRVETLK